MVEGKILGGPTTELVKRSPPASSHGVVRSRTARLKDVIGARDRDRTKSVKMIRPGLWRISLRPVGLKATRGNLPF